MIQDLECYVDNYLKIDDGRNSSKLWEKLRRNLSALRFWYNVCNMMLYQESVAGERVGNCGQWHLEREIGHGAYGVVFFRRRPDFVV